MEIKILHFYPDLMSLYGSYANVSVLTRYLQQLGHTVTVESLRPGAGEAVHEVPDHRHHIATGGAEQDGHQHKAGNEVHHRPRGQNDELPPGGFVGKGAGVVVLLILPLHGAVAADGQKPKRI